MDFLNNIREQLPDSRVVSGLAFNALQTVGDNLNDIGNKIQNSQIADRIKNTIQNAGDNSAERNDMIRSQHIERRPLTSPNSDSDDEDVRIDMPRANKNNNDTAGWYTDNGGESSEDTSMFSRLSSYFKQPEEAPPVRESVPTPEPVVIQPQSSTWQDSFSSSFGSLKSSIEGGINSLTGQPVPQEEPTWYGSILNKVDNAFSLSSKQRMYGFFISLAVGVLFMIISIAMLPSILFMAKSFAVVYSLGNLFLLTSVCFLVGPVQQLRSMFVPSRMIASGVYLLSLIMTLVAALGLQNAGLVVLMLILQVLSLSWYILSYVPFAQRLITMLFSTAGRSLF